MAIIKKNKEEKTKKDKPAGWSGVLQRVAIRVIGTQGYMLVYVKDKDNLKILDDAPVDVTIQDDVVLFNLSRFCRAAVSGVETEVDSLACKGIANVKLRLADYDYKYKGKTGHTTKLEVIGMAILKSEPVGDALDALIETDVDDVDLDDLPF